MHVGLAFQQQTLCDFYKVISIRLVAASLCRGELQRDHPHGGTAPWLHQLKFWRDFRGPWIDFVVGLDDLVGVRRQELAERRDIQPMMSRSEGR